MFGTPDRITELLGLENIFRVTKSSHGTDVKSFIVSGMIAPFPTGGMLKLLVKWLLCTSEDSCYFETHTILLYLCREHCREL